MRSFPLLIAALLATALTCVSAGAAEPWPVRVGRISLAETGAALRPGGGQWADATINEPVAAGNSIRSGTQGRAEIRLSGITIMLAPGATLDINRLDKDATHYGGYTEPDWFHHGIRPVVFPWLVLPQVGLSWRVAERVAIDLDTGLSLSGFTTGLGLRVAP